MAEEKENIQPVIEDLSVSEAEADAVKGGPVFMKFPDIDGEVIGSGGGAQGGTVKGGWDVVANKKI